VQQIKLAEGRLTGLEDRIQVYEDRFHDLEDQDDLMKKYKELSEAQNHFIEAQRIRISQLEGQNTAHTGELARICQLNRDLSAVIHCRDITIGELEKRAVECASNNTAIANIFQDHSSYEPSCLDSRALNYAGQVDIFTEFFPTDHAEKCTTEVAESTVSQTFATADEPSPVLSRWHLKESASPNWHTAAWLR
jgi:hypothetical protein